jgi:hypothetical protein
MTKYYCQNCGKKIRIYERRIITIINPNYGTLSKNHTIAKAQVGKECCLKIIDEHMKKMNKKLPFKQV